MKDSRLVQTLQSFSTWEHKHLRDFLYSPFHNKNVRVRRLFDHLRAALDRDDEEALKGKPCFAAIYEGQPFQAQKLYNIASLLFRAIKAYISHARHAKQKGEMQLNVLYDQVLRQDWKGFRREFRTSGPLELRADAWDAFSPDLLGYKREVLHIHHDLAVDRLSTTAFYAANAHLDRFYWGAKLKMACEFLNRGQVIALEKGAGMGMTALAGHVQDLEQAGELEPTLRMYLYIYKMLREPEQPAHCTICIQFLRQAARQEVPELRDGLTYAINYCIRRINAGQQEFRLHLFELYEWAVREKLLEENGTLGEWHFKNIVSIALREKRFGWAGDFIAGHWKLLPEAVRENAYAYNMASLLFSQGDYAAAQKLLLKVQFRDVFYSLDSKVLLARIYYEAAEFEALGNLLESFAVYISRNKVLSQSQLRIYKHFVAFLRKLLRLMEDQERMAEGEFGARRDRLASELLKNRDVAQYPWLMEKVEAGAYPGFDTSTDSFSAT